MLMLTRLTSRVAPLCGLVTRVALPITPSRSALNSLAEGNYGTVAVMVRPSISFITSKIHVLHQCFTKGMLIQIYGSWFKSQPVAKLMSCGHLPFCQLFMRPKVPR